MISIIEDIKQRLKKDPQKTLRRILAATFVILVLVYSGFEYLNFCALKKLDHFDFNLRPVSGLIVFSEPKHLQLNQRLSLEEVENHLKNIDYKSVSGNPTPGSYAITDKQLVIEPIFPEHSPVKITFKKNSIVRIEEKKKRLETQYEQQNNDPWQEVRETIIEPEKLQTSIMENVQGIEQPGSFQEMNVHRKIATRSEVVESDFLNCVKAVEDGNFENHNGIDFWSLLRIPYQALTKFKLIGSSTVEMQAIRNTVLNSKERGLAGIVRKIDELILASNLKSHYQKDSAKTDQDVKEEILTLYANSCYMGKRKGFPNVYGFSSAAELYYGKNSMKQLSLAQMMTLVVLNHGPNNYIKSGSGTIDYDKLQKRRDTHLKKLRDLLPPQRGTEIDAALNEPIRFIDKLVSPIRSDLDTISLPFVRYAFNHPALTSLKKDSPEKYSHLNIYTTINADLMRAAHLVLKKKLPEIAKKYPPQNRTCRIPEKDGTLTVKENNLLGMIVASNVRTGEIISFYGAEFGSKGLQDSSTALNLKVQPASVYKSWVLAEALKKARLDDGQRFTPLTKIPPTGQTIRELLKDSSNDAPKWLCSLEGLKNDCALNLYSQLMGESISPESPKNVPLGLSGGQEMPALRINESFNIFANRGNFIGSTPFASLYVDGKLENDNPNAYRPESFPAIDAGIAFLTSNILKDVITNGTAAESFHSSGVSSETEIFGKSGSGRHFTLFAGSSAEITVTAIVSYDCPTDVHPYRNVKFTASHSSTIIWMEYLREVQKYRPDLLDKKFFAPKSVIELKIDKSKACRSVEAKSTAYFLQDALPSSCTP